MNYEDVFLAEGHPRLPVHGFVLAGGKSTRMGRDKALLPFQGRPMVEIAVEKLRGFCAEVSIVGDRPDLQRFAPVISGERANFGPAAGIERGLQSCREPWAVFVPVDVPLVSSHFLQLWIREALRVDMSVSFLAAWRKQPAFCLLRKERAASFSSLFRAGEKRLEHLLNGAAEADNVASWMYDPYDIYGFPKYQGPDDETLERWFANINTPEELAIAETWVRSFEEKPGEPPREGTVA